MSEMLNTHTARGRMPDLHIPTYAKENPTKLSWRWSDAGMLDEEGRPMTVNDSLGMQRYYVNGRGLVYLGK